MRLFSAPEPEFHLDDSTFEVCPQRTERQSLLLQCAAQPLNFACVQQQFAVAIWLVLGKEGSPLVWRDSHVDKPRLAAAQPNEPVAQAAPVRAHAFHFGAGQYQTGFEFVDERELVKGTAIRRDRFDAVVSHLRPAPLPARLRSAHATPRNAFRLLPTGCPRSP